MLTDLRANPEVLWGALIAFGVVVLLTPAVGGMARLLGVVDQPDARRLNKRPIPRLGGLAIFLGILVPSLAFLDLSGEMRGILLGAAVACVVGAVDDFRGLDPLPKLAGQVAAAAIPCAFGVWIDHFTFPFLGAVDLPAWVGMPLTVVWIVAVMNMVNFLDGMDGLASGVCAIAGLTFATLALSLGQDRRRRALGDRRRGLHRLPPAQLLPGPDLHGRLRGARARLHAGDGLGRRPLEDGVDRRPRSCRSWSSRCRSSTPRSSSRSGSSTGSRSPRADRSHLHHRFMDIGFSQRRAAVTMWAWTASLGAAALATRFIPFREGGQWHPGETIAVVAIALGALAFSVYVVYLLEIVKLANPRVRRRRAQASDEERLSA